MKLQRGDGATCEGVWCVLLGNEGLVGLVGFAVLILRGRSLGEAGICDTGVIGDAGTVDEFTPIILRLVGNANSSTKSARERKRRTGTARTP